MPLCIFQRSVFDLRSDVLLFLLLTILGLSTGPLAAQQCRPVEVENPAGNYIIPGTLGAITYREVEGKALKLDAYVQSGKERRPGVLVVHGGKWTSGSRVAFVPQFLEMLTDAGFNWFSIDYRLAPRSKHPAAVDDLEAALEFIRCNARSFKLDPERLAILAEDSGVQAGLLAASRHPTQVAALVGIGGFYDLQSIEFFRDSGKFAGVFGSAPNAQEKNAKLGKASPIKNTPEGLPPVLLIHGTQDRESPIEHAEDYCLKVEASGSTCRLEAVQGGIHRPENWTPLQWEYKRTVTDWLLNTLEPVPPPVPAVSRSRRLKKDIVYGSYEDTHGNKQNLLMDAFLPESGEPTPAIILAHGGGWEAGDKITYLTPILAPLAEAGFAWFSIDYRLTPEFRNWDQLDDLRRSIRYVRANAHDFNVDPTRISILGESASGQMVTQIGSLPCAGDPTAADPVERQNCEVQAVVSFYGVYDFLPMVKDASSRSLARRLFGRTELDEETRSLLREYSPYYHVNPGMPPLLLVNGTNEYLWGQAELLMEKLKEIGAEVDLIKLVGAPHGMENWEGRLEWQFYKQEMVNWLQRKLK
jgi:alpha-L-fucosidase 2